MPSLSIIIPTHERPEILRKCLEHIERQTVAKDLEVIVVHDGKDDGDTRVLFTAPTPPVRTARPGGYPLPPTTYVSILKSQQGVARNCGVDRATAPLVLFIGDDIFLAPDACETHVRAHASYERSAMSYEKNGPLKAQSSKLKAVLGFTTWDPTVGITKAMRWLEKTGWQFGYPKIRKYVHAMIPKAIQHRFTYTSNISLPTDIARKIRFREDVTLYGWEDIEWGIRLREAGVHLFYEPDAKALHHHHVTLEDSLKRMETLGRSIVHIEKLNPALGRMPRGWKLLAYHILAGVPSMRGTHYRAFLRGKLESQNKIA